MVMLKTRNVGKNGIGRKNKTSKHMRNTLYIFVVSTLLLIVGCTKEIEDSASGYKYPDFSAQIEENGSKTFVDNNLRLYWNAEDCISVFSSTYNRKYQFKGETGDRKGAFSDIDGSFSAGEEIPTNYAVYPFNVNTSISRDGEINLSLPITQSYAECSFGKESNTMIAVTVDHASRDLTFNNTCGFLVVKLYGEGKVKSIKLEGNNGEKISGAAKVSPKFGDKPFVQMCDNATTSITLDCGTGVQLGTTPETATEFWFCVPPTEFSKGFKITVVNSFGWGMVKTTADTKSVVRNVVNSMSALEVVFDTRIYNNEIFTDEVFKSYCLDHFDTDHDGELSEEEALAVTRIEIGKDIVGITNLGGIGKFKNLESFNYQDYDSTIPDSGTLLYADFSDLKKIRHIDVISFALEQIEVSGCDNLQYLLSSDGDSKLKYLDVSNLLLLDTLYISSSVLETLDISNNIHLSLLCVYAPISHLDLSNNTNLKRLTIGRSDLTALDLRHNQKLQHLRIGYTNPNLCSVNLSNNIALTYLNFQSGSMTELDISACKELTEFRCSSPQIKSLEIDNFPKLQSLALSNNKSLSKLIVNNNAVLSDVNCSNCQLTDLLINNNPALVSLKCGGNQISSLDISGNPSLDFLRCSPMETLETLYIYPGQSIPNVTFNRSPEYIPENTEIVSVDMVDMGLSVKWATCNLGASTPEEYGGYYQWAGLEDVTDTSIYLDWGNCPYHTGSNNTSGWTKYITSVQVSSEPGTDSPDDKTVLDPSDDVVHVKLGDKWRMPTVEEFEELIDNCQCDWITYKGVNGYKFTSKKVGYTDKWIFFPAAGQRSGSDLELVGSYGYYWSSSLRKFLSMRGTVYGIYFHQNDVFKRYICARYYGNSVRPVYGDRVSVIGVSLSKTSLNLEVGATHYLYKTVTPSNAAEQSVSWSSNDTSVATVDQSGKVTALKAGVATITVRTTDGGYTAACNVSVEINPSGSGDDFNWGN